MITVIATAIGWPDQYVWMAVLAICEDACESPELVLEGGVGHYLSGHLPILLCVLMVPGSAPSLPASDRPKLCHCFGHWTVISRSLSFLIPTTGLFRGCQKCSTFHHLVKVPIGNDRSQHHWMIGNLLKNDQMVHWNFHIQPLQRKFIVCIYQIDLRRFQLSNPAWRSFSHQRIELGLPDRQVKSGALSWDLIMIMKSFMNLLLFSIVTRFFRLAMKSLWQT